MNRSKESKISASLIALSIVINFANYIVFYNDINPFYEFFSFLAFIAGTLGITVFPLGIAAVIAVLFIISKTHKHSYLYYFAILFLILSLFFVVISVSNAAYEKDALIPSETITPSASVAGQIQTATGEQTGSEIKEGWVRIKIADVGSIDYPTDFLELSFGEYRDLEIQFLQVFELDKTDFTLQQVGLNLLEPSALEEYRRVLFKTDYLNPGEEVFRSGEKYTASQAELTEFKNELIDQLQQEYAKQKTVGVDNRIIDSGSVEIMEVNRMFPLVYTYKRQLGDNPIVLVKSYMFFNYDKIHSLSFSYRVVDEEEYRDIYEKILDSFRLD